MQKTVEKQGQGHAGSVMLSVVCQGTRPTSETCRELPDMK